MYVFGFIDTVTFPDIEPVDLSISKLIGKDGVIAYSYPGSPARPTTGIKGVIVES